MEEFIATQLSSPVPVPKMSSATVRGGQRATRVAVAAKHMTPEERNAASFKGISDKAYGVWGGEMILGGLGSLAGMGAAKMGFHRIGASLKMFKSPFRMLNRTTFNDIHKARANTLSSAADVSQITGGTAAPWAESLRDTSARALEKDTAIASRIGAFFAPLRKAIGNLFDSSAFKWLEKPLEKLRAWRVTVNAKKEATAVANIITVATERAKKAGDLTALSMAESLAKNAEGLSGHALADAMSRGAEQMKGMVHGTELVGKEAKAVFAVGSAFHNAAQAATATAAHEAASGAGVRGLVKNLAKMGGRMSLLQGIIAVGAVAGVAAIWATLKAENKNAKKAIQDMTADVGDPKNPYLESVAKLTEKQKGRRVIAAGASSIAEAANVGMMSMTGGGMAGMGSMMALQMGLPMLGQVIVPENAVLNAYANLQKTERGEAPMTDAEKIAQVRHLVGAVPTVVPHGGYYNKLCEPIAAKIVEKKLSLRDTMQLLTNHEKFTAFAAEVKAAQAAVAPATHEKPVATAPLNHEAPAAEPEDKDISTHTPEIAFRQAEANARHEREHAAGHGSHPGHTLHHEASHDHAPYLAAEKPGKIDLSEISHKGMLEQPELAMGQQ